jgi:hypothetical protein
MDGPNFRAYIGQFVVPILPHGDIVVMDNRREIAHDLEPPIIRGDARRRDRNIFRYGVIVEVAAAGRGKWSKIRGGTPRFR